MTPDFVAKVWLGNAYAGEQVFKGRSIDSNRLNVPMSYLVEQGGTSNLILDKQGPGRLYYPNRIEVRAERSPETRSGGLRVHCAPQIRRRSTIRKTSSRIRTEPGLSRPGRASV
ncbi:MAG: hypothetical protein IPN69_17775 [Acidobacteria bacterium]|nr:hypothetical protein [Acidobacteriota bacterium]